MRKSAFIFFIIAFLLPQISHSQDTILKLNGVRLNTKILKENENEVVCTLSEKKFKSLQNLNKNIHGWSIGLGISATLPFIEIKHNKLFSFSIYSNSIREAVNVDISRKISSYITLQGQYTFSQLYGRRFDNGFNGRNTYFQTDLNEFTLNAIINLNKIFFPSFNDEVSRFGVYVKAGAGLLKYRSIERVLNSDSVIRSFGYNNNGETYGKMLSTFVIPVGAGIKYRISNSFDIRLEGLMKFTGTNNIEADNNNTKSGKYAITTLELTYKPGKASLTNQRTIDKSDIFYLKYSDGRKIITFKEDSIATVENMGKYIEGEEYAMKTYKPVISTIGSVVAGLTGGYLAFYGALIPAAYVVGTSSVSPALKDEKNRPVIPQNRLNNKYFIQGYKDKARRIELKRSIEGGLAGLAAMIIIKSINFKLKKM